MLSPLARIAAALSTGFILCIIAAQLGGGLADSPQVTFVGMPNSITLLDIYRGTRLNVAEDLDGIPVSMSWSPDGTRLAYTVLRQNVYTLFAIDFRTGRTNSIAYNPGTAAAPTWSPGSDRLAYLDPHRDICVYDFGTTAHTCLAVGAVLSPDWSHDGQVIAYIERDGDAGLLRAVSPTDASARTIVGVPPLSSEPLWSPDDRMLAYTAAVRGNEAFQITLVDARSGTQTAISPPGSVSFSAAWSPDGTRLAYTQEVGTNRDVMLYRLADGTTDRLTTAPNHEMFAAWSGDGRRLAYVITTGFSVELMLVDAQTLRATPVTEMLSVAFAWR